MMRAPTLLLALLLLVQRTTAAPQRAPSPSGPNLPAAITVMGSDPQAYEVVLGAPLRR
jgi:hypothetical protein